MKKSLWTLVIVAHAAIGWADTFDTPPPRNPVDVVVFSDFQCPFCALFSGPLRDVQATGVDGVPVRVTFKHFPLPMHVNAPLAHQAALAAGEQKRFWEMHDLLFARQQRLRRDDVISYAMQLGLDIDRFRRDLDSERLKQIVAADQHDGEELLVNATPTFFVNGRRFAGYVPLAELRQIVRAEAQRPGSAVPDASMSLGAPDAPVVVELFVDLLSPLSRRALDVAADLVKRRPADMRVQFRHLPLDFHPQAMLAHEAAVAAAADERFWDFARYLIDHPWSITRADLAAAAGRLDLEPTAFAKALDDHRYADRVRVDLQSGRERGIRGSPTFVVNGRRLDGVPTLDVLTKYVDAALASTYDADQMRKHQ